MWRAAEAFYGVPIEMIEECRNRMGGDMRVVMERFDRMLCRNQS